METIVAAGSSFTGNVDAEYVTIAGEFEGEIRASSRVRIVPGGRVRGKLAASDVEIAGSFSGELECLRLSLRAGSKAEGRFIAERLRIDEGAEAQGAFNDESPVLAVVAAPAA